MTVSVLSQRISELISGHRFTYNSEADLQDSIWQLLTETFSSVDREVVVGAGSRIDFVVDRVGIEVKTKGSAVSVARQLLRYAGSDKLDELVLVTHKRGSADLLLESIGGKPLTVVWIGGVL